jgi:L-aspartate oxidase
LKSYDLIVVGSGLAGLSCALLAAEWGDVLVLTKAHLEDCNTYYAQGGIAAALTEVDSPAVHYRDTMVAGDGLCDPAAVQVLTREGPRRVRELIRWGVPFDRVDGEITMTREAAHTYPRVLHAGGDATGARIETTVVGQVRAAPRITLRENCLVYALNRRAGRITGVRALDETTGQSVEFTAGAVVLATGGAGQLYSQTTNPTVATGDGIAVAFRAGAAIADTEFYQFHPTALALPGAPRFLISEAVRGEGGILRNGRGERFMSRYDERAELAPRDVVARAIAFEMERSGDPCAYLDVTHLGLEHVRRRFPTISRVCAEFGLDLGREPIPVAPAAHYFMGGIQTNIWGETSLAGLYACGECACTGVHGANRLASNSLLEAMVFGARIVRRHCGPTAPEAGGTDEPGDAADTDLLPPQNVAVPTPKAAPAPPLTADRLRDLTWRQAGLVRRAQGLREVVDTTGAWLAAIRPALRRPDLELADLTLLAHLVSTAALLREESRGAHYRLDFPTRQPIWHRRLVLSRARERTVHARA